MVTPSSMASQAKHNLANGEFLIAYNFHADVETAVAG